ncbi:MAG: cob(I)yrinic acid a,c-diamide adenosyltransferase [Sphaerochaetaceae bacterium]|nr:cob(I)yrinic acid a,c-diamide adenosyltransferase [Sphaerochaetaceae bacterium]MDD3163167.1 cob(I)yrinic acid a,c-diamide adenosyltransferase [Sphaerochaetaceae bacterium]MDD4007781.1 cob(I)yrinic acid a,c-diamide adenosyltransferase [Sphaerochaetaceae bacterium]MDD4397511.1 cob(I)yrinic acid a,c-diamide adenosyltransferase [Sphaerochaetaceae bacterium]
MKPLVMVFTGDGKGKTTAALGCVFRALGRNGRCAVIQFIKPESQESGEKMMACKCGLLWENYGKGFLWNQESLAPTREQVLKGFKRVRELASGGQYDLIALDEITYAFSYGLLDEAEFLKWLELFKAQENGPCLILTGRGASEALINAADTVTEMKNIKHHYSSEQRKACPFIEF